MTPRHSPAILSNQEANVKDPEVQKLAQGILESQGRETPGMKATLVQMNK